MQVYKIQNNNVNLPFKGYFSPYPGDEKWRVREVSPKNNQAGPYLENFKLNADMVTDMYQPKTKPESGLFKVIVELINGRAFEYERIGEPVFRSDEEDYLKGFVNGIKERTGKAEIARNILVHRQAFLDNVDRFDQSNAFPFISR